jgi:4-hydroxybenzoate polyprenyltransferase
MNRHLQGSIARRLWLYQAERFPLVKTATLVAIFVAGNITMAAALDHHALPSWPGYGVAWLVTTIVFFQMRAADEIKDLEDDRLYRPERPIPSGLVSLRLIVGMALGLSVVAAVLAALLSVKLVVILGLIWAWLGLMTAEFFAPRWLKARPLAYLGSHMLIMPLIALFAMRCQGEITIHALSVGLGLLLVLAYLNGCVLEVGRKIYAPEKERPGVDTYSALWGLQRATAFFMGTVLAGFCVLFLLVSGFIRFPAVAALAAAGVVAYRHATAPSAKSQKQIEQVAGLWVFVSNAILVCAPLLNATS